MQIQNHWKIPKPQMFQGPESEITGETKSGRRSRREARKEGSRETKGC